MDAERFDSLTRTLTDASSRRGIVGLFAGTVLASPLIESVDGRKKKRCKPCRKKKKGKCKRKKPDGTSCGEGMVCQNGKCISDPQAAGCTSNNDFCAQQWASCLEMPECRCFVTVEGDGICGNTAGFEGCPTTTECTSSLQCADVEFCVNLSCCPEGKAVCIPLCVPPD